MRIETDTPALEAALRRIQALLLEHSGFVADDLVIRERDGIFSSAIDQQEHVAGRTLVSYPMKLAVPMHKLTWADRADLMEPVDGTDMLKPVHRDLLQAWLMLVNETGKLRRVREGLPSAGVEDETLRAHLAAGGHPVMDTPVASTRDLQRTVVDWHSTSVTASEQGGQPGTYLYHLKNLVNHHHTGAPQGPFDCRTGVITSATSSRAETFENYGDLDAFQLLVAMGYVPRDAPMVHSIPLDLDDPVFGRVRLLRKARRGSWQTPPPTAPLLRPTPEGLNIAHLTARPGNRGATVAFLAMALQASHRATPQAATAAADALLDSIAAANIDYYRELDRLLGQPDVLAGTGHTVHALLREMSAAQQRTLQAHWG